jgi:hypothetical protein
MPNPTPDRIVWLRDKLQSWPGEMLLTSYEIDDLLTILKDYQAIQERFDKFVRGVQQLICDIADKPRGTGA